jgi:hypothetical protein
MKAYRGVCEELAESELALLTVAIASTNAWNRIAMAYRFLLRYHKTASRGRKKILYLADFFRSWESEVSVLHREWCNFFFCADRLKNGLFSVLLSNPIRKWFSARPVVPHSALG